MGILKGVIPVLPTPFTDNGKYVDFGSVENLVDMAIREGAHALCLFAAGAEFYKLTWEEKKELYHRITITNRGRVPIIPTVSSHATTLAVREAIYYEKKGALALNIMPPSFAKPTQNMVAEHLIEIANAVNLPVMIQYAPALTGMYIAGDTLKKISKGGERELYIKLEALPTGPAITELKKQTSNAFQIIVGNGGECMYEALERGACAVMPGVALLQVYRMIYDAFEKNNQREAFELFNRFLPYIHLMQRDIESFVAMEKLVLKRRGILKNAVCRKPNHYPDSQTLKLLELHLEYIRKEFAII